MHSLQCLALKRPRTSHIHSRPHIYSKPPPAACCLCMWVCAGIHLGFVPMECSKDVCIGIRLPPAGGGRIANATLAFAPPT